MATVTRSLSLPESHSRAANEASQRLGMDFSELVRSALIAYYYSELGWTRAEVGAK